MSPTLKVAIEIELEGAFLVVASQTLHRFTLRRLQSVIR